MRIPRCAPGNSPPCLRRLFRLAGAATLFFWLGPLFLPPLARGAETIVVNVVLNGENKGDLFVERTGDGDFLVREEDLKGIGFRRPRGRVAGVGGERFLSLDSIEGLSYVFREKTLSLELTASPTLLPTRTIDFLPERKENVYYPKDSGGFLNYRIGYSAGDSFEFAGWDAATQLGARVGDYLFLSDGSYTRTPGEERFVRLMTSVTYDRRETMQRAVAGDFFASSGDLGAGVNLGGVSVSKVFRIDPYFYRYPLADFSGLVSMPSEVEIYLDGMRVRTEKLAPGGFELRNLSHSTGASLVTVVVRDPFGTERRVEYPYYFTDTLLREGLHEYSYNAGFLRKDFGEASNRYGRAAFSAFHRYGLSDAVTVGGRTEGGGGVVNLGPEASLRVRNYGVLTASLSGSHDDGRGEGAAGLLRHVYQDRTVSARIFLGGFSREYAVIGEENEAVRRKFEAGAGVGYGTRRIGSISLDWSVARQHDGPERRTASVSYSRNLTRNLTVFLSYRNSREEESRDEAFVALTYYPWRDVFASAGYRGGNGDRTATVQVQKNAPAGEGYGVRASIERSDSSARSATTANPFIQYNGRYGIYSAEYRSDVVDQGDTSETTRLTASGGIAYVGGRVGFSRPVTDSFGLVRVGDLEGVRVYRNGQEIGRTDASGKVFVPDLSSYYENQVSIDDKDIPMEYSISEVLRYVSPPLRSGSAISFDVKRFQAITGKISMTGDGATVPAEYYEVRMTTHEGEISFPTGKGGEFYLEDVPPGRYRATLSRPGRPCGFDVVIPVSGEMLIDLGELTCAEIP